jgi:protein-disulfide isomerase
MTSGANYLTPMHYRSARQQHSPAALAAALIIAAAAASSCGGSTDNSSAQKSPTPEIATSTAQSAYDTLPPSVKAAIDSMLLVADDSRTRGSRDAKVWLIVMSDFQCPFCRNFHAETFPQIIKEYVDPGLVRVAFINFPGISHVHAKAAAEHALCAGLQGKFWEYHDALFHSFEGWTRSSPEESIRHFDTLAVTLKLDSAKFDACVASNMMRRLVTADALRSNQAGASATPSFLIGNRFIEGAKSIEVFRSQLDAELKAANTPAASRGRGGP